MAIMLPTMANRNIQDFIRCSFVLQMLWNEVFYEILNRGIIVEKVLEGKIP